MGIVIFLVCACGSKDASPPPAPTPTPPIEVRPPTELGVDHLPQPAVDLPRQLSFRLLDPGKGETSTLRYQIAQAEVTTRIAMTLTSRRMDGSTWSPSQTLPEIRTALATAAIDATHLRARPLPGSVDGAASPEALAYLAGWTQSENRRLTLGLDARGQLGAITFGDDPQTTHSREAVDDLAQRLLSLVVPVPEEPIGIGASWRVVTVLTQRPVVVKQTATYTLLQRTTTGWTVKVELQRIGEEQTILDPAISSNTKVDLVALVRRYAGTLEIAPARALPTGSLEIESSMHLRLQPRTGPVGEQILEDKGTVVLSIDH